MDVERISAIPSSLKLVISILGTVIALAGAVFVWLSSSAMRAAGKTTTLSNREGVVLVPLVVVWLVLFLGRFFLPGSH